MAQPGGAKGGNGNGSPGEGVSGILTNRRLMVTLLLLMLVSAGLITWLLYAMQEVRNEARSRFFEQYNRQQLLLAEQASRTVEELFDTFHHHLNLISGLFENGEVDSLRVAEVDGTLKKIYESLKTTPAIDMAIFDARGTVINSYPPSPGTIGVNLGWREYFIWARDKGKPYQMYLTPLLTMNAGKAKGHKALIVAEGIYGKDGSFKGLVIITLNFDELGKKYILPVRIGKNGYAWLVDVKNHMALVDPRNRVTDRSFEDAMLPRWKRLYELVMSADLEKSGTGWYEYEDPEDESRVVIKLVGYSPVRIGDHRWLLGVATPDYEIEALLGTFIRNQENFTFSVAMSILFGALVACLLLVGWNTMLSRRVTARTADLAAAREKLVAAEKLAAVGHLALGLTHEIRNPLSAIRMNVQMIRQESPDNALLQENFTIIEEEIHRLNRLLGDVMGFARPRPLKLSKTDLGAIVDRVVTLLSRQLQESGVGVRIRMDGDLSAVCDPEQLQQVVLNLLLNAMEAMEETEGEKTVSIVVKRTDETVVLEVGDSGVGIGREMLAKIFDPFFTTKAQGGGLGLATLQSIVLRHGGTVEAASEGAGATFTVRLPAAGPTLEEEARA